MTDAWRSAASGADFLGYELLHRACRDIDSLSAALGPHGDGTLVSATFVRARLDATMRMCLLIISTDPRQGTPGSLSTGEDCSLRGSPVSPTDAGAPQAAPELFRVFARSRSAGSPSF